MEGKKMAKAKEKREIWCQKSKNGSVFPAKRRSVKKMIWDSIVKAIFKSINGNNSVHPCT
ncbi:hypothetical protein HN51_018259 [Arachis hypogaea]